VFLWDFIVCYSINRLVANSQIKLVRVRMVKLHRPRRDCMGPGSGFIRRLGVNKE